MGGDARKEGMGRLISKWGDGLATELFCEVANAASWFGGGTPLILTVWYHGFDSGARKMLKGWVFFKREEDKKRFRRAPFGDQVPLTKKL